MIKTFPFLTITVYIPTSCVGVLIGKRGSNIDSIQKLAAKESTKLQSSPRGPRNKNSKQNKNNKAVSPDSVRISVVNYPPPPSNSAHNYEQYFTNLHNSGPDAGYAANSNQQQPTSGVDMSVPPTYTELDFSDPQWTPIVIRADPIAAIHAANAIHDICCPEYVVDRNQLVYILDVPVPAVAPASSNNANLRHASIVGKRGNKLIQLSADHKCRIMVPPKQLGHDIIQLEAPLKECCSCLKAIMGKLQAGGSSDEKEGDAAKISPSSPQAKNAKNNAKGNNANNKNKNDNSTKNSFQISLIIQPLPSQTKLRNIARKTETKILKKRIPKSQQRNIDNNLKPNPAQQEENTEAKQPPEQSSDETEGANQTSEKQESGSGNPNSNSENKISWKLTILGTTEKKVSKAVDMLKVLNSKGYELIIEESIVNNNSVDTSNKSVPEGALGGGSESETADMITDDTAEGAKRAPITNGHGGRGPGRGGKRKPKPRYRNNHRGNNNGKDNNGNAKQQAATPAAPTAATGES